MLVFATRESCKGLLASEGKSKFRGKAAPPTAADRAPCTASSELFAPATLSAFAKAKAIRTHKGEKRTERNVEKIQQIFLYLFSQWRKMNILICDDVAKDANELADMLAESGFGAKTVVFTCPWQAYNHVKSGVIVDVCFLDILMPAMNGIKLAEKMRESSFAGEIIFLTTSNGFASQSYRVKAFDYMIKPPNRERVSVVLNALQRLHANEDRNGLSVKTQGVAMIIPFRDISYIEADKHNVNIKLLDESIVKVYSSFSEITEQILSDKRFLQCHRSFIVNLNEINTITNTEVFMRIGKIIPISKGYMQVREKIIKWIFREKFKKRAK
jgi:DNA-binding LytR/AlgR family response regulator